MSSNEVMASWGKGEVPAGMAFLSCTWEARCFVVCRHAFLEVFIILYSSCMHICGYLGTPGHPYTTPSGVSYQLLYEFVFISFQ